MALDPALERTGYDLRPGQRVLITGAGCSVGHLAVQLAHHLGATVIAVASADTIGCSVTALLDLHRGSYGATDGLSGPLYAKKLLIMLTIYWHVALRTWNLSAGGGASEGPDRAHCAGDGVCYER